MIDQETIDEAVRRPLAAAPPDSQGVLFGSYARVNASEDSDVDFPVVELQLSSRHQEMARLRRVLRPLGIPVDVLVVSRQAFEDWKSAPNNVVFEAAREGRVFTHAA